MIVGIVAIVLIGFGLFWFIKKMNVPLSEGAKAELKNNLSGQGKNQITLEFTKNALAEPYCIVFDTETTGLIKDRKIRPSKKSINENNTNFPYLVSLSWILLSRNKELISEGNYIIKCSENISPEAIEVHGITNEQSQNEGENLNKVLKKFTEDCSKCTAIVAHNVMFDKYTIEAECIRNKLPKPFTRKTIYDTVQMGKRYMKTSKFPSLRELCLFIYGNEIEKHLNSHSSLYDTFFTSHCFFIMKNELKIYNK